MIDLKNSDTPADEARDEVIDLPPPPSDSHGTATTRREPIGLPEDPGHRPEMAEGRGRRGDQLGGEEGKKLIIGEDIVLNGRISSVDRLVVEGRVEVKLKDCREIEIGETGHFKGEVEFERADVAGIFEGDLTVREHLVVRSTGLITGKVRFGELEIERGGQILGDVQEFVEGAQTNGKGAAADRKKAEVAKAKRTTAAKAKRTPAAKAKRAAPAAKGKAKAKK